MVHFDASVLCGESPVHGRSGLVLLPGPRFRHSEDLFIGDAPTQDSPGQDAELYSCHGEPTAVLGSNLRGVSSANTPQKGWHP